MDEIESLAHTKWECKYHVVWIPKYRRKALYGELRKYLGPLLRELAKVNESLERANRKLTNTDFLDKAPAEVVSRQRATQAELQDARGKLQEGLGRIEALLKR
jgi:valyl-tRNA synthetase